MSHSTTSVVLVSLVVSLFGPSKAFGSSFQVSDSAGIQIIRSEHPTWEEDEGWQVDPAPTLDISGEDDEGLFRLGSPRVMSDGRIVLFNGGNCEVRFYSDTGDLLATYGRCGEGPGEFGQRSSIWPWPGDSLLISRAPTHVTIVDGGGLGGRTVRLTGSKDLPFPGVMGTLEDGGLVLSGLRDPGGRGNPGIDTADFSLGLIPKLGDTLQLLGTYPGPVYLYSEFRGQLGRDLLPFSGRSKFAVGGGQIFVGSPDRYEIQVLGSDGRLRQIFRRPFQPVEVTQADIDWLMERRLEQVDGTENQRLVRQAYRDLAHADFMPAFGVPIWVGTSPEGGPDMILDSDGNLWVFDCYRPGEYRNQFTVFSPEGEWLGAVKLPDQLKPSQIGPDFLVGTWTDALGFTHVRKHRLIKP